MKWITEVMEEQATERHKQFIEQFKRRKMETTIPRRAILSECTPAEIAIYDATQEVEMMGADVRLTDAINLLQQARDKVADFVDDTNK